MKQTISNSNRLTLAAGIVIALVSACGSENTESKIASAKHFIAAHDDKSAIIELKDALQKAPASAEARFLLGNELLESGDSVSAENELRQARSLKYPQDRVAPRLARAMLNIGEAQRVIDEFSSLKLNNAGASADLDSVIGFAYLKLRNQSEAKKVFSLALAEVPGHLQALLGEAMLKAFDHDLAGAKTEVDSVLKRSPDLLEALAFKADLLAASNDSDGAQDLYDKIILLHPDNIRAHYARVMLSLSTQKLDVAASQLAAMKKVAPHSPQTQYLQALLSLRRNQLPEAREATQQLLGVAPNFLPGQLVAGEVAYRLNAYAQAEDHLQRVVAKVPGNVPARRLLTATYLRDGQPSRALETLKPLLSDQLTDNSLLMLAGEVYLNNNELALAEKYFTKAAALDKNNSSARIRLGQLRFADGDPQAGLNELQAAVEMDATKYQADVLLITAYMRRNELVQAMAAVANLEKKQPKNPLTFYLRSEVLLLKGDRVASRKDLEHSLELDQTYFPAALTLAKLDVQDKKWDSAKQRFEKIIGKDPNNPQALLALAQLRADTGAPSKDVVELIDRAVSGNPGSVEPRLAKVRYYLSHGDPKQAVSSALSAQEAIPRNPAILEFLGASQQAAGDINQAIATYSKVVDMRPQATEPLLQLAAGELADKRNEAAGDTLKKALALKPDLLSAQLNLIYIDGAAGRSVDALAIARNIQKQRPGVSVGYLVEGDIFAREKKWTNAVNAYRSGMNKLHTADLAIKLHEALLAGGRPAEASELALEWAKGNPKDILFRTYLAERSVTARNYDSAAQQYKAILAINPKNPLALNNLAWVAGQLKDPKAIGYAEQADALAPNTPAILDTLAMLLVEGDQSARGISLLRRAIGLAPNSWIFHIDLAKALARAGQKDEARKELEPLLKLNEGNPARVSAGELLKTL
ncbi:MAG TPA: XrtA/PEP-CTERM system TPR-repeat protein PrsT [Rhodocyclaceae bacterium]|nr:XrtA/PEP-CTERM system TPR-repeat protein PrsT [Rhodocyclaceae bacterium]